MKKNREEDAKPLPRAAVIEAVLSTPKGPAPDSDDEDDSTAAARKKKLAGDDEPVRLVTVRLCLLGVFGSICSGIIELVDNVSSYITAGSCVCARGSKCFLDVEGRESGRTVQSNGRTAGR